MAFVTTQPYGASMKRPISVYMETSPMPAGTKTSSYTLCTPSPITFMSFGVWSGLYATPIIYPITFIADRNPKAAKLVMMNPLAQIIQDMRYFLIDKANTPVWLLVHNKFLVLVPYILPILIFLVGFAYFNKHAKKFAEIL